MHLGATIRNKLDLPQVTLLAVTSVAIEATVSALEKCLARARFGQVLLFSDNEPCNLGDSDIKWIRIKRLNSRSEYSKFILYDLGGYVETTHALIVQWDGFVSSFGIWSEEFLKYDYVGAPWPQYSDNMNVGNGGFSLRSQRLLKACSHIPSVEELEDVTICRVNRVWLERDYDIRFADLDVARRFSYERGESTGFEFGFHGVFNMPAELPNDALMAVLASLEPGVIGERESGEMLILALRTCDWRLARLILRHHRVHPRRRWRLIRNLCGVLFSHNGLQARRPKV
jgi:hypothetical protein